MRLHSFFFAAKIAALFILLLGLSLGGALVLFLRVAAPELARDIGRLRAIEASRIADHVEAHLARRSGDGETLALDATPDDDPLLELLRRLEDESGLGLRFGDTTRPPEPRRGWRYRLQPPDVTVDGRTIAQLGPPAYDLFVPLRLDGEAVGHLRVRGPSHAIRIHLAFERGLLRIAGLSLFSVLVLSVVLTRPLRRMSRSMDRIADGELDHRVDVAGRDEVAAMGHSFNAMADRIQGMIRGQQEMLAGVSHELRSPLGRMKMTLALLRDRGPSGDGHRGGPPRADAKRLHDLDAEIDHIDGLIQELLTATRLDLGTAPLQLESVELGPAVEHAWTLALKNAEPDGGLNNPAGEALSLRTDLDGLSVRADPRLLARVLGNLLGNARRYARSTVTVGAEARDGRVIIDVSDDGPGVEPDHLERLFEPFFRADSARAHTHHVGMGLAIVHKSVAAHGGHVRAAASAEGGLCVTVDFEAVDGGR
ncbi:MAG: ATP-binding protein [Acidobacteriota bacterium]